MGDGRAEGLSATREEGQAALSLIPDVDGTCPGSLLDSILSALFKKKNHTVISELCLFLAIDRSVALDCVLNGCCNLHVLFYIQVLCLKKLPTSSNIENPLVIPCIMNPFSSSVTSAFSRLS